MKIILSLSLATRTVLVVLIAGFVVGVIVGYRAGEQSGDSQNPVGSPGDARALSLIIDGVPVGAVGRDDPVGDRP